MLFPVLILSVMISLGSASRIENRNIVGITVRASFWKLINRIKTFNEEVVEDMWKFSFRGFAVYSLGLCDFGKEENIRIQKLIADWESALEAYAQTNSLAFPEKPKGQNNDTQFQIHLSQHRVYLEEYYALTDQIKANVKIIEGNTAWMETYQQLQSLETITGKFKLGANDFESVNDILDEVLAEITDKADLESVLNNLKLEYQKIFPVERVVNSLSLIDPKGDSELKSELADLVKNRDSLKTQITKLRNSFLSKIDAMSIKLKKQLKKNANYIEHEKMMKQATDLLEMLKNLKLDMMTEQEVNSYIDNGYLMKSWRRVRVPSGTILKMEDEIDELNKALTMTELIPEMDTELHKDEKYQKSLTKVLVAKGGYKDLINLELEKKQAEYLELENFANLSLQLDNEFAKMMADLMSGDTESGKVYFTSEELSVIIYFMNISKVIYSQTQFLTSLFLFLSKTACQNLVTRMRLDILEVDNAQNLETDPLCLIEDPNQDPFAQPPSVFIRDYSLLLSSQKSFIFKDLITPIGSKYLTFTFYMNFLGVTPSSIQAIVKKVVFAEFFKTMIKMLFVLLELGTGVPFLISTLTMFIIYLVNFILDKIGKQVPNYAEIKKCLLGEMDSIYKALFVTDFENLNYEEKFKNLQGLYKENFFSKLKRKPDQMKELFTSKFAFFERSPWMVDFTALPVKNFRRLI